MSIVKEVGSMLKRAALYVPRKLRNTIRKPSMDLDTGQTMKRWEIEQKIGHWMSDTEFRPRFTTTVHIPYLINSTLYPNPSHMQVIALETPETFWESIGLKGEKPGRVIAIFERKHGKPTGSIKWIPFGEKKTCGNAIAIEDILGQPFKQNESVRVIRVLSAVRVIHLDETNGHPTGTQEIIPLELHPDTASVLYNFERYQLDRIRMPNSSPDIISKQAKTDKRLGMGALGNNIIIKDPDQE